MKLLLHEFKLFRGENCPDSFWLAVTAVEIAVDIVVVSVDIAYAPPAISLPRLWHSYNKIVCR